MFEIGQTVISGAGIGKVKIAGEDKDGKTFLIEIDGAIGKETKWFRENEISATNNEIYLKEG